MALILMDYQLILKSQPIPKPKMYYTVHLDGDISTCNVLYCTFRLVILVHVMYYTVHLDWRY